MPTEPELEHAVIGAGLAGLVVAGRNQAARLYEQQPFPGGHARTLRSEGHVCELGPFAFAPDELANLTAPLATAPAAIAALPAAGTGFLWTDKGLLSTPVQPTPHSFRGGTEDLITAYRRELGDRLRLGRAVTSLAPAAGGWQLTLGGEVPTDVTARSVTLALDTQAATALLRPLDPRLDDVAARLRREPRAFVYVGFTQGDVAECLTGYGILPADGVDTPIAEAIFCTNVFPRRALPGHALVRLEILGDLAGRPDDELTAAATAELARWTGLSARIRFQRVHRFTTGYRDAAWTEASTRLRDLLGRAPDLHWTGAPAR